MANYICQPITPKVSSRFIGKITVPEGGLHPGQIVLADTLNNSIAGNYEVFNATTPSTDNLNSNFFAVVLNDGFETLEDGRRPDGNPNYYTYTYKAGETAPVIFLDNHLEFNISFDSIEPSTKNLAVAGNYLIPVAGSTLLNASTEIPNGVSTGLKILTLHNTPSGNNFGASFIPSMICIPVNYGDVDTEAMLKSFSIPNQVGNTTINQATGDVSLLYTGAKTSLVPTFTVSRDATVTVNNVKQVSGTTANNFSSVVNYVVTSESGVNKTYKVNVISTRTLALSETNATADIKDASGASVTIDDLLYDGEVLTINATPAEGYTGVTILVNGASFTPGSTYTVTSDTTVSVEGTITTE